MSCNDSEEGGGGGGQGDKDEKRLEKFMGRKERRKSSLNKPLQVII